MQTSTITKIVLLAAISGFLLTYIGIQNYIMYAFNPYKEAASQLSRAKTAQTPDEVIYHTTLAKRTLPESGSVSWWSPESGDFESMQAELDNIIDRAENISRLEPENETYISEMTAMHAEIRLIQATLGF